MHLAVLSDWRFQFCSALHPWVVPKLRVFTCACTH